MASSRCLHLLLLCILSSSLLLSVVSASNCTNIDIKYTAEQNSKAEGFDANAAISVGLHIGPIASLSQVDLTGKSLHETFDARQTSAIIGAPGGDLGEWLLALQAYVSAGGVCTTQTEADTLFKNFIYNASLITSSRPFTFSQDTTTLAHLGTSAAGLVTLAAGATRTAALAKLITTAGEASRPIQGLISSPTTYGTTSSLVTFGITAAYNGMWAFNDLGQANLFTVADMGSATWSTGTQTLNMDTSDSCVDGITVAIVPTKDVSSGGVTTSSKLNVNSFDAIKFYRSKASVYFSTQAYTSAKSAHYAPLPHHRKLMMDEIASRSVASSELSATLLGKMNVLGRSQLQSFSDNYGSGSILNGTVLKYVYTPAVPDPPSAANSVVPMWVIIIFGGIVPALVGILVAFVLAFLVLSRPRGNDLMIEIADAIQDGSTAFLKAEYTYLAIFVAIVAVLLWVFLSWISMVAFVTGAVTSALTGFIGMSIATRANVRTAAAAMNEGLNGALKLAFYSGAVMGLTTVSLGLISLSVCYILFVSEIQIINFIPYLGTSAGTTSDIAKITSFGFGASAIALFARVGGGIYTKAADVGADLVGKVEAGIPEDDPRNPAVIADNVGDNVGDVAGMGADLFESFVGSIIAATTLGFTAYGVNGMVFPFIIAASGILCSIVGIFLVRCNEGASQDELLLSIRVGILASAILVFGVSMVLTLFIGLPLTLWFCIVIGLVAGILIGFSTEYYTSFAYEPTLSIARSGVTGPATVTIQGLSVGMMSTLPPVLIVSAAIVSCVYFGGIYGVALAAVGMLSTLGVTLATDAYGPVADNAGGIAEMAGLPEEVREKTDALDALGNTTAATGKGFAIGSAVLTALALLSAFSEAVVVEQVDLIADTLVIPGLLIGALLPFIFAALTMTAVKEAAMSIIEEVRRQFREISGLLEGKAKADHATCVAMCTKASLRQMVIPGVLAVLAPLLVGLLLGPKALAGVLLGSIVSGFLLAVMMANAGGAWDNAKKWVEAGNFGGKGSETHKAVVVGDTIGDPFKDTSGPALNILLKLMSIVSLVFAPLFYASGAKATQFSYLAVFLIVAVLVAIYVLKWAIPFIIAKIKVVKAKMAAKKVAKEGAENDAQGGSGASPEEELKLVSAAAEAEAAEAKKAEEEAAAAKKAEEEAAAAKKAEEEAAAARKAEEEAAAAKKAEEEAAAAKKAEEEAAAAKKAEEEAAAAAKKAEEEAAEKAEAEEAQEELASALLG